jgi:hypothetical protein
VIKLKKDDKFYILTVEDKYSCQELVITPKEAKEIISKLKKIGTSKK